MERDHTPFTPRKKVQGAYQAQQGKLLPAETIPNVRKGPLFARKEQMMVSEIPAYVNSERIALRIDTTSCILLQLGSWNISSWSSFC